MPIQKRWSEATAERIRTTVPRRTGVYELSADDEIVYIGRARNLQRAILNHAAAEEPEQFRYELVDFLSSPERRHRDHFDRYVETNDAVPAWMDNRP